MASPSQINGSQSRGYRRSGAPASWDRHSAQLFDNFRNDFNSAIDLRLGIEPAKEKRKLRRASSPFGFMARSTCEASCEPSGQADPAEQQMRLRSNKRRAAGDLIPSNEKLDVFGTRGAPAPLTDAPLTIWRIASSNRSRMDPMCALPSDRNSRSSVRPLCPDRLLKRRFLFHRGARFPGHRQRLMGESEFAD